VPSEYTLHPVGEIDIARVQELQSSWLAQLDQHEPDCLIIDLSAVTFLDSSGISLILGMHKRQAKAGGQVVVIKAPTFIRKLLAMTAIDQVIDVRP
jgi:anti-anti-sigma factor